MPPARAAIASPRRWRIAIPFAGRRDPPYIGRMTDAAFDIADVRAFLYRDGALDPDGARRLTADALGNCDDGELYLQYRASEAFGFDDGRLKTASYDTRCRVRPARRFGRDDRASPMPTRSRRRDPPRGGDDGAARSGQPGPKAAPPQRTNRHLYTDADPLDAGAVRRQGEAAAQTIDAAARARDPRVAQVSRRLSGSWTVVEIVRADGFVATDVRPLVRLNVSIVVEQNGRRETGSFGMGGRYLYDDLFEPRRGTARSTRRWRRRWSISMRSPRRPAR